MDIFDLLGINQVLEWGKEIIGIKSSKEDKPIYHPEEIKPIKFSFRPENLNQYIGQENAKKLINLTIKKIKTLKPVHIIISGSKGCGKSTLANIIENELGFNMVWHIGGAFTMRALEQFLIRNQDSDIPLILFIDEIHNLPKEIAEYLYPIIEDFILPNGSNQKLRRFIFIGATTEKNILIKKFAPLVDRCGADLILEPYKKEDMVKIIQQANDILYKKNIDISLFEKIAENCRFTPRIALSMLDDLIVSEDIDLVLSSRRIIKNSLTDIDIRILNHLAEVNKPVGVEALAMIAGITREDYSYILEPFLIYNNYLTRTARGRLISNKGKLLLQELK